jgi:hypothetical protein
MKIIISFILVLALIWIGANMNTKVNPHHSLKRAVTLIWEGK